MTPRLLSFALVASFAFGHVPGALAVPFVFPDRPGILFAFPDETIDSGWWYPDEIMFGGSAATAGLTSGSGGGYGSGGSGSGGIGGSNGFNQSAFEVFGPDALPFGLDPTAFSSNGAAPSNDPVSSFFNSPGGTGFFGSGPFTEFPTAALLGLTLGEEIDLSQLLDTPSTSPAPEPASLLLLGAGAASLVAHRYRQHRRSASRHT